MSKTDEVRPNRLGRGLSALLGYEEGAVPKPEARGAPRTLPIAQLFPSPLQPRKSFDPAALAELTSSVKEKGVLIPILVRPSPKGDGTHEIIAGERRWRAAQAAGIHDVPVVIREMSDGQVLEAALIENIQRADLNAIEEARGFKTLIDQFRYTQDQLSKVVGKSRSHIANALRLLGLPAPIQAQIEANAISAGHARALIGRDDAEALAKRIVEEGLSVRAVEELVRGPSAKPDLPPVKLSRPSVSKDVNTAGLERRLGNALGLKVKIVEKGGEKGEVRIRYTKLEQLDDIVHRLTGE